MNSNKFKIGDKVKILKNDTWSCESMKTNIGEIGVITNYSNDKYSGKIVFGYEICLENNKSYYFYQEDSLKLVSDGQQRMTRKNDVLSILYETKEDGVSNYGIMCDLIRRVRELPCK